MKNGRTILIRALMAFVVLLAVLQVVPYGRAHTNPPVTGEPSWDSAATRALFVRACADCHGNETRWPWYSHVAPVSWLVQSDVDEGREHFNVSEWGRAGRNEGDEAAEQVQEGEMPPWLYPPIHPDARLSAVEKQSLIRGLAATFGNDEQGHGRRHDEDDSDDD